ncbi:synaptotagmin-3-like isoform X1 [Macadamia integrifolia]|uniref:synaptotagmin-3-like isoform X1 n=1 Tax=Macadamia integrifolia TaxID=60698 RepID=UPI001C52737E|nr:synaptotagmin-3-like isoform X1 [Macadamia integrifolia]
MLRKVCLEPIVRSLYELDSNALSDLLAEIPLWVKNPDYDRVDWLNKFAHDMWPYLDKAICSRIRSIAAPKIAEYIGKYQIKSIEFESLTLGTLPPTISGIKVYESNETELVIELVVKWAGNPNITLVLKLLSLQVTVQLVDLQIFAVPRITLRPLVPSFPCFAGIVVSLMEKPHVDFGLKLLGGDIMAIPGLYRFVQETIKREVGRLYLWPQIFEIPILDSSMLSMSVKKPVGVLHVKVIRAVKLLRMDFLGASDPYVKVSLTGERLPAKKTTIKMKNLNPEWNEQFKLIVKDPESQALQLHVYDWDKVGSHDKLGMQVVPLRFLSPHEAKEFTLDLLKNTDANDPQNKKRRGQIIVELTYKPFNEDIDKSNGPLDGCTKKDSMRGKAQGDEVSNGPGVILVTVRGAEDVEGKTHNNPYALVLFRGEKKKTKMLRKTRDPRWNEEFQFMVEEVLVNEKIHIEVMSKRSGFSFRHKESLGYVDIDLTDVVNNGRINEKYHLIESRNGVVHIEIQWNTI